MNVMKFMPRRNKMIKNPNKANKEMRIENCKRKEKDIRNDSLFSARSQTDCLHMQKKRKMESNTAS